MATYEIPTLGLDRKIRSKFLPTNLATKTDITDALAGYTPGGGGGATTASALSFTPAGTIASTTVQAAIVEVGGDAAQALASAQTATNAAATATAASVGAPWEFYTTTGGVLGGTEDAAGTYPQHPVTKRTLVYTNPNVQPTRDGNRDTGGGGMDVRPGRPDRWVSG